MPSKMMSLKWANVTAALALAVSGVVLFQPLQAVAEYPEKPIKLMVGYGAGGRFDTFARLLAEHGREALGQPIVVENRGGAGGSVMASQLKVAKPDGYTLGLSNVTTWSFNPNWVPDTPFTYDDFTFVSILSYAKPGLITRPDAPWNSLKEMFADAKAHNRTLTFAGIGPHTRLMIQSIAQQEGIKIRIVPTRGASAVTPMVMGGHVDFGFGGGSHRPLVKDGQLKLLADTNDEPDPEFPNVPNFRQLGYEPKPAAYVILAGPRGIPTPIVEKLTTVLKQIIQKPEVIKAADDMYGPIIYFDGKRTKEIIVQQSNYYKRLIDASRNKDHK